MRNIIATQKLIMPVISTIRISKLTFCNFSQSPVTYFHINPCGCFQDLVFSLSDEPAQISDEEVSAASAEFQGLSDIVLCSLPDTLLQPLLGRLNVEGSQFISQQPISAKQWLWSADPALRSVVAKEALQWHRGMLSQVNRRTCVTS
jgi:hypothetical protein